MLKVVKDIFKIEKNNGYRILKFFIYSVDRKTKPTLYYRHILIYYKANMYINCFILSSKHNAIN